MIQITNHGHPFTIFWDCLRVLPLGNGAKIIRNHVWMFLELAE